MRVGTLRAVHHDQLSKGDACVAPIGGAGNANNERTKGKRNMKFRIAIIAALATLATVAIAGQVADRSAAITLSRTAGTATWTNTLQYGAVELDRIDITASYDAVSTVTVSRVTSGGALTNVIGTVALTAGVGSYNIVPTTSTGPKFLQFGDKVTFANSTATGAVAYIDYIVQKH